MALRVIGAGLGRTGTTSLCDALATLLEGNCYHFEEVIANPAHVIVWEEAIDGVEVDWDVIFGGYVATTDWPGAAFWRELWKANPDAMILLSTRPTSDEWFDSVERTIDQLMTRRFDGPAPPWHSMARRLLAATFVATPFDRRKAIAAYERHNEAVRREVPEESLIDWQPGDGWSSLCRGLGIPIPDKPFPHLNSRVDFETTLAAAEGSSSKDPVRLWKWIRRTRRGLSDRT